MPNVKDKVVVITGASSGIGEAAARLLAKSGASVVLAARRENNLRKITDEITHAGGKARYKATDVTARAQVEALVAYASKEFGRIDVMVNNAGLMALAPLNALQVDEWDRMIDINLKGVMYGTAAVLSQMLEKGGHIINVASIAGLKVFPGAAVYCATKHAVRAFSEGVRMEVGDKVRVTLISPGAIDTELPDHITHPETQAFAKEIYKLAIPSDSIARAIHYAIGEPHEVDVNEIVIRPVLQEL